MKQDAAGFAARHKALADRCGGDMCLAIGVISTDGTLSGCCERLGHKGPHAWEIWPDARLYEPEPFQVQASFDFNMSQGASV